MSTQNPSTRIRKKSTKNQRQLSTGESGLPAFSAPNAADTEKNRLKGFGNDDGEINYLKRLALRAQISSHGGYNKFVPDLSELEIQTSEYLEQLNKLNRDPNSRVTCTALQSRFNSTSFFNIAQELAQLKLARESVLEIETLIDSGVAGWLNRATGAGSEGAKRATSRKTFAELAPRTVTEP